MDYISEMKDFIYTSLDYIISYRIKIHVKNNGGNKSAE